ncbi:hypothetical protein [Rhodococcus koreensis]|uniref:hypothetical protein n=1 Tax=Rhodococcus koreensis TaxID=99653 RepID=UPI00366DBEDC
MYEREGVDPLTASRAQVGVYVRELTERPSRRGANGVSLDSRSGPANATIAQRLVPVRPFYDHLMAETRGIHRNGDARSWGAPPCG